MRIGNARMLVRTRFQQGRMGRSREARDAHHRRRRLERCAATLDGDRRCLPERAKGQEGLRGEAAQLRRVPPHAPPLGQPQVRLVRWRDRAREREGERLLRLPQRLAPILREQGSHLAKAAGGEGRRRAERRGSQAQRPRGRLRAHGEEDQGALLARARGAPAREDRAESRRDARAQLHRVHRVRPRDAGARRRARAGRGAGEDAHRRRRQNVTVSPCDRVSGAPCGRCGRYVSVVPSAAPTRRHGTDSSIGVAAEPWPARIELRLS